MIDHTTNTRPVAPDTFVRVEYRAPALSSGVFLPARLFDWTIGNAPSDIMRYEVKS